MSINTEYLSAGFILYYCTAYDMCIITSNKTGSTFLDNLLLEKQTLFKRRSVIDDKDAELILTYTNRIFWYREPLDRFLSWYHSFMYNPSVPEYKHTETTIPLIQKIYTHRSFKKNILQNVYDFVTNVPLEDIKEYLKLDTHTIPLYSFFEYTKLEPEQFIITDVSELNNFSVSTFNHWVQHNTSQLPVQMTDENIFLLNKINTIFHKIYEKDYKILKPLVKPYTGTK